MNTFRLNLEAMLVLLSTNHDGSNIQINGPFDSSIVAPCGKLYAVSNKAIIKAARMNRLRGLN